MAKGRMTDDIAMTDQRFAANIVGKYGRIAERSIRRSGFVHLTPNKRQSAARSAGALRIDVRHSHAHYYIKLLHTLHLAFSTANFPQMALTPTRKESLTTRISTPVRQHQQQASNNQASTSRQHRQSSGQTAQLPVFQKLDVRQLAWLRQTLRREQSKIKSERKTNMLHDEHVRTHKIARIVTYRSTLFTAEAAQTVASVRQQHAPHTGSPARHDQPQSSTGARRDTGNRADLPVRHLQLGMREVRIHYTRLEQLVSRLPRHLHALVAQQRDGGNRMLSTDEGVAPGQAASMTDVSVEIPASASRQRVKLKVQWRTTDRAAVEPLIRQAVLRLPDDARLRKIDRGTSKLPSSSGLIHRLSTAGAHGPLSARRASAGNERQPMRLAVTVSRPQAADDVSRAIPAASVPALRLRNGQHRPAADQPRSNAAVQRSSAGARGSHEPMTARELRPMISQAWRHLLPPAFSLGRATAGGKDGQGQSIAEQGRRRFATLLQRWQQRSADPSRLRMANLPQVALIQRTASRKAASVFSSSASSSASVRSSGPVSRQGDGKMDSRPQVQAGRPPQEQVNANMNMGVGVNMVTARLGTRSRAALQPAAPRIPAVHPIGSQPREMRVPPITRTTIRALAPVTRRMARLHAPSASGFSAGASSSAEHAPPDRQHVQRRSGFRPLQLIARHAERMAASRGRRSPQMSTPGPGGTAEGRSPAQRRSVLHTPQQRDPVVKPPVASSGQHRLPLTADLQSDAPRRAFRSGVAPAGRLLHRRSASQGLRARRGQTEATGNGNVRQRQGLADSQSLVQAADIFLRRLVTAHATQVRAAARSAQPTRTGSRQAAGGQPAGHAGGQSAGQRSVASQTVTGPATVQTASLAAPNTLDRLAEQVSLMPPDRQRGVAAIGRPRASSGGLAILVYGPSVRPGAPSAMGGAGSRAAASGGAWRWQTAIQSADSLLSSTAAGTLAASPQMRRLIQSVASSGSMARGTLPRRAAFGQRMGTLQLLQPRRLAMRAGQSATAASGPAASASPSVGGAQSDRQRSVPATPARTAASRIIVHLSGWREESGGSEASATSGSAQPSSTARPSANAGERTGQAAAGNVPAARLSARRHPGRTPLVAAPRPVWQRGGAFAKGARAAMLTPRPFTRSQPAQPVDGALPASAASLSPGAAASQSSAAALTLASGARATRAPSLMHKQATLRAQSATAAIGGAVPQQVERRQSTRPVSLEFAVRAHARSGSKLDQESVIRQSLQQLETDMKELRVKTAAPVIDVAALSDQMYREISRRMRFEQQRRGL